MGRRKTGSKPVKPPKSEGGGFKIVVHDDDLSPRRKTFRPTRRFKNPAGRIRRGSLRRTKHKGSDKD